VSLNRLAVLGLVMGPVLLAPLLLTDYQLHVAITSLYYVIITSAWNFLAGRAGIFSLGIHALSGLSAYTSALTLLYLGLPIYVTISLGVLVAAFLSFFLAFLTLKMRGIYLALTTWAFAEISRLVISTEYEVTRGDLGLQTVRLFGLRELTLYYYLFLALSFTTLLFLHKLINSKYGLYIWAVGQDPVSASVLGIDVFKWRVLATTLSGAVAGLAGAFFGHYLGVLAPSLLAFHEMATIIMMSIIGGFGTLYGPVVGVVAIQALFEGFRVYREWRLVASSLGRFDNGETS
jgi:branched-chain amino acid transport system permease protein